MTRKVLLSIEFLALFFGIPLLIYFDRDFIHPSMIILPALIFIFLLLRYTTDFRIRELFQWNISRKDLARNGLILMVCAVLMIAYVLVFEPENLFNLPRANPWIFVAMCFFYPVFSAFGQEVIYRTFLYRRYGSLYPGEWHFILVSGISFSFVHIVYYDPVSMILTCFGGLYFARIYVKTRSVLFSAILHGVLGIMVFGIGLGQYFWLDIPI
jgi:membrane protease YdiL (CAAX protease family)